MVLDTFHSCSDLDIFRLCKQNNPFLSDFDTASQPALDQSVNNNNTCQSPAADIGNNNVGTNDQYIFISDCLSGPPIARNKNINQLSFDLVRESASSLPDEPPPPPPKASPDRLVSGEFYDIPRSLQPVPTGEDSSLDSDLSNHLPPIRTPTTPSTPVTPFRDSNPTFSWSGLPPRVNWNTYPADSVLSSLDMHQILETSEATASLDSCSLNESDSQRGSLEADVCETIRSQFVPPPRPPKPANLGENRKYENMSPVLGMPSTNRLSADSKVPPPPPSGILSPDELYDFPRPLHEGVVDIIAQSSPGSSLRRPRRHAYTNAPAGFIEDESNVFRYDVSATNSVSSQQPYLSMDAGSDVYTDMSTGHSTPSSTPTAVGAVYCNVSPGIDGSMTIIDLPPAINRNLKPRKKAVDSEGNAAVFPSSIASGI